MYGIFAIFGEDLHRDSKRFAQNITLIRKFVARPVRFGHGTNAIHRGDLLRRCCIDARRSQDPLDPLRLILCQYRRIRLRGACRVCGVPSRDLPEKFRRHNGIGAALPRRTVVGERSRSGDRRM